MAILLAAISAATFGVADFYGGLSARRMSAVLTSATTQLVGLGVILLGCTIVAGSPSRADVAFGSLGGLSGGIGVMAFYWAMSAAPMSVIAPVSAVTSAMVPICAGLLAGDRPAPLAVVGIALALPAILTISRGLAAIDPATGVLHPDGSPTGPRTTESHQGVVAVDGRPGATSGTVLPVAVAVLSGIGFGGYIVALSATSDASGLWPIASARSTAAALAVVVCAIGRPRPTVGGLHLAVVAGVLDVVGNMFYVYAARQGLLALVGVVGSMYPASTVLLARVVLHERLERHQVAGLFVAVVAVVLIAAG